MRTCPLCGYPWQEHRAAWVESDTQRRWERGLVLLALGIALVFVTVLVLLAPDPGASVQW